MSSVFQNLALIDRRTRRRENCRSCCGRLSVFHLIRLTFLSTVLTTCTVLFWFWTISSSTGGGSLSGSLQQYPQSKQWTTLPTACHGYKGILHIAQGDVEGAAGTIFFLFVLNQLQYAERYQLLPWIHLSNTSHYIFDPQVHGKTWWRHHNTTSGAPSILSLFADVHVTWSQYHDPITNQIHAYPGPPMRFQTQPDMPRNRYDVPIPPGNGVWSTYFEPVSEYFTPYQPPYYDSRHQNQLVSTTNQRINGDNADNSSNFQIEDTFCYHKLPYIRLTHQQIIPALHVHCPWSLRAWRYGGLPPGLVQSRPIVTENDDRQRLNNEFTTTKTKLWKNENNANRHSLVSYHDWFLPMRERGSQLVQKYVHPLPYLIRLANRANPVQTIPPGTTPSGNFTRCLAIHIRHSDKANRRKRIPVRSFLPYVEAYVDVIKSTSAFSAGLIYPSIYLATDSQQVLAEIQGTWPLEVRRALSWQEYTKDSSLVENMTQMIRSNDTTPVFSNNLTRSHQHISNLQVLVDILAMSNCHYFLHGHSAVSEATHYFHYPQLHNHSVNLEYPRKHRPTVSDFGKLIRDDLSAAATLLRGSKE